MFRIRLLTFCTTPRGPVRADHLREPALAAVAVADGGPRCDLLDRVRRNVDDLKTARGRRRSLVANFQYPCLTPETRFELT